MVNDIINNATQNSSKISKIPEIPQMSEVSEIKSTRKTANEYFIDSEAPKEYKNENYNKSDLLTSRPHEIETKLKMLRMQYEEQDKNVMKCIGK